MRRRSSGLGFSPEVHATRFYKAFDALQDIGTSQRERPRCRAKYAALLKALRLQGLLLAEFQALGDAPREAHLMRQADGWVYQMTVDFDRNCTRGF